MSDHYRRDSDPPSFSQIFDELTDRVERVEALRDEWANGAQTGREITVRLQEIATLAQQMEAAQYADDAESRALAAASPADFMEDR